MKIPHVALRDDGPGLADYTILDKLIWLEEDDEVELDECAKRLGEEESSGGNNDYLVDVWSVTALIKNHEEEIVKVKKMLAEQEVS